MLNRAEDSTDPPLVRWVRVFKESAVLVGFIVTGTLLYSNITNSISMLKDANDQRKEEIKHLQEAQDSASTLVNKKLDDISKAQSDQLLQITKLATQLDYRGQVPQQFQRRN